MFKKAILISLISTPFISGLGSTDVLAAARPQAVAPSSSVSTLSATVAPTSSSSTPSVVQAAPYLPVLVQPMDQVTEFPLPNVSASTPIDLTAGLSTIFQTEVGKLSKFQPLTSVSGSPITYPACGLKLIRLSAQVPVLTLQDSEAKLTIGYNSSGVINPVAGAIAATGTVDLHIGYLLVTMKLETCDAQNCTEVIATSVDASVSTVQSNITVDVGNFSPSFDLLFSTDLNKRIAAAMDQALLNLQNDPRVSQLPWQSQISAVDAVNGIVTFQSGTSGGIGLNQAFTAYQNVSEAGMSCPIQVEIGTLKTTGVEVGSSTAKLDDPSLASRVQVGDVVMIHPLSP